MTKLRASWAGQNKHIKANFIFKMFLSTPTHVVKKKFGGLGPRAGPILPTSEYELNMN